jgi:16S rRNA (cytidine1402-2'-O)-methyltransferase
MTGPTEDDAAPYDPMLDPDVLEELEFWGGADDDGSDPPGSEETEDPTAGPPGADGTPSGPGSLVLVGTPIGNLGDLSPRAVEALSGADVIYCEDTRHSRKLLTHAGIAGIPLRSLHEHNEDERVGEVVAAVATGRTVALVTDAGMPGISDPGSRVVRAVADAGLVVSVVPGPSAVLAALVTSGLATDRFCFEGFLPRSGRERTQRLEQVAVEPRTVVLFEAPTRVRATLGDLVASCGTERRVAVARELTKRFEEVWRGTLADAVQWAEQTPPRGEVVVVVDGAPQVEAESVADATLVAALEDRLAAGERTRGAVDEVAALFGVPRRRVYELALAARES